MIPGWVGEIPWRRASLPTPVYLGFLCGSVGKEYTCNAGDLGSIFGLGRSPTEGKGYLLQYSGLENSMDCIAHGVAKSQTQRSDFHFTFQVIQYLFIWPFNLFKLFVIICWISIVKNGTLLSFPMHTHIPSLIFLTITNFIDNLQNNDKFYSINTCVYIEYLNIIYN